MKELLHTYAFDENGNILKAEALTEQDRVRHQFYIWGIDKVTKERIKENVSVVIGATKRSHFRRYPVGSSKRNESFVLNNKSWKETVLHELAKELFRKNKITRILLPPCIHKSREGTRQIVAESESMFVIQNIKIEYNDTQINRRYDVLLEDINGRELALEFYVKHRIDRNKTTDIISINREMIELDISDLISKEEDTFEEIIIDRLTKLSDISKLYWINNSFYNKLEKWMHEQKHFDMYLTDFQKETDGQWFIRTRDRYDDIPNCPYYNQIKFGSKTQMVQNYCEKCARCMILSWNGTFGRMVCNQSQISNLDIIKMLYNE